MARSPSPSREAGRRAPADDGRVPPWLEEAEPLDEPTHTLVGRRTLYLILGALVLLVLGVATGVLMTIRKDPGPIAEPGSEVPLVQSPGPWKEPADGLPEAAGRQVEGQGQILFDTGVGGAPEAAIDVSRLPEEPMLPGQEPAAAAATGQGAPMVLLPDVPARSPAPAPPTEPAETAAPADVAPAASGPPVTLQLGAYSTPARAREAFQSLAQRHAPLAGLSPQISAVSRDDGSTLHRLRVTVADRAAGQRLCARLKVAGDACALVE
jgi:hypothetical protein